MSSARKIQRRASAQKPMGTLTQALKAVDQLKGLQGNLAALGELDELLKSVREGIKSLELGLVVQREVTIRMLLGNDLDLKDERLKYLRDLEQQVRSQVLSENGIEET